MLTEFAVTLWCTCLAPTEKSKLKRLHVTSMGKLIEGETSPKMSSAEFKSGTYIEAILAQCTGLGWDRVKLDFEVFYRSWVQYLRC